MSGSDFWSRRRAGVRAEQDAERKAAERAETEAREAELEEKSDEEILEDLGLPDPDTLIDGDDFKPFLAKAVPERLRRRALRRLWRSNPVLANLDGLVDYGDDYTDAATVVADLRTAYEVGKGIAARFETVAAVARPEAAEQDEDQNQSNPPEDCTNSGNPSPDAVASAEDIPDYVENSAGRPRRMRYRFDV